MMKYGKGVLSFKKKQTGLGNVSCARKKLDEHTTKASIPTQFLMQFSQLSVYDNNNGTYSSTGEEKMDGCLFKVGQKICHILMYSGLFPYEKILKICPCSSFPLLVILLAMQGNVVGPVSFLSCWIFIYVHIKYFSRQQSLMLLVAGEIVFLYFFQQS